MENEKNSYIERALGLPQGFLSKKENLDLPETKALLKIISTFKFIPILADYKYDRKLANLFLMSEATNINIQERIRELSHKDTWT